MKSKVIILLMLISVLSYSQTKKNGTVFIEHPAIIMVEAMQKAYIAGDSEKTGSFLADNFRFFDGTNTDKDAEGIPKEDFLKWTEWNKENIAYGSIERQEGAYPDAIEYKESGTWVQTWDIQRGIHNKTGVKMDRPVHTLFLINDSNKISTMIEYASNPFRQIGESNTARTNGVIYNQHENINKVRRMIGALEHSDIDKAFSYFTEDARFSNMNMPRNEFSSVTEEKEGFKKMLEKYDIESIDVVGYPDYLEYEIGKGKSVLSWWNVRFIRKSDKKKIVMPAHFIHDFDDEGMITREIGYYNPSLLDN